MSRTRPSLCPARCARLRTQLHDGRLVALAYYDLGTRFLEIAANGRIKEVGWFLPYAGVTSSTYWVTEEIVRAIDYSRGFDILRFKR